MLMFRTCVILLVAALFCQSTSLGKTVVVRTQVRKATVRVSTAKLRKVPTESGRTLGLLDHDAVLKVVAVRSGWVQVQTKRGTIGWVRRDLVSVSTSTVVTTKTVERTTKASDTKVKQQVKSAQNTPSQPKAVKTALPLATPRSVVKVVDDSTGQLPETVEPVNAAVAEPIAVVDTIAEKRSSVVGFAQVVANATKNNSPTRSTLMSRANAQRGTPYRFGTSGGGTYDCSGFTSAMYRKIGMRLPRTAAEQFGVGQRVAKPALTKGDLVFFRNTAGRRGISHVGIYSGNGMFIHASSRGHAVRTDTLSSGYYASHFAGARRLIR